MLMNKTNNFCLHKFVCFTFLVDYHILVRMHKEILISQPDTLQIIEIQYKQCWMEFCWFTYFIESTLTSLWSAVSSAGAATVLSALSYCLDLLRLLPVNVEYSMRLEQRTSCLGAQRSHSSCSTVTPGSGGW